MGSSHSVRGRGRSKPVAIARGDRKRDALGGRLLQLNRKLDAIAVLTLNTELHPQSADACGHLADVCLKCGNRNLAAQWHRKALELDPKRQASIDSLKNIDQ